MPKKKKAGRGRVASKRVRTIPVRRILLELPRSIADRVDEAIRVHNESRPFRIGRTQWIGERLAEAADAALKENDDDKQGQPKPRAAKRTRRKAAG